jgi:hypothetical protein
MRRKVDEPHEKNSVLVLFAVKKLSLSFDIFIQHYPGNANTTTITSFDLLTLPLKI